MTDANEFQVVDLDCAIILPGQNDRTVFDEQALQELAGSIREEGLIQPITVRPIALCGACGHRQPIIAGHDQDSQDRPNLQGQPCPTCGAVSWSQRYEIVAGERRFRAVSTILNWATVKGMVREMTDEQADGVMLAENLSRKDLDPVDEAEAYHKRMERHGWDVAEVARRANVGSRRVDNRLKLLRLVPEAQDLIRKGHLSLNFAMVMYDLSPLYQRKAMEYFTTTDKPLLRAFEAVVGKLRVAQAQTSLFDLAGFELEAVVDAHNDAEARRKTRRFPTDRTLPLMRKTGTIGLSFETYIHELMTSDDPAHRAAAAIVGRVYEGMLAGGMAFAPRAKSPLDDWGKE